MDLIKEITINDPPSKWVLKYKKPKFDKDGKLIKEQVFYLNANLFYSDRTSYHITSKIIKDSKEFLYPYLKCIPPMEKLKMELYYYHTKDIDLDNKGFYWRKLIFDILKTPTKRQIELANKRKNPIITTNCIDDDNTKVIRTNFEHFEIGEHRMVLKFYGRPKVEQKKMDLFFI